MSLSFWRSHHFYLVQGGRIVKKDGAHPLLRRIISRLIWPWKSFFLISQYVVQNQPINYLPKLVPPNFCWWNENCKDTCGWVGVFSCCPCRTSCRWGWPGCPLGRSLHGTAHHHHHHHRCRHHHNCHHDHLNNNISLLKRVEFSLRIRWRCHHWPKLDRAGCG